MTIIRNTGEAINDIAGISDVKQFLSFVVAGATPVSPYQLQKDAFGNPIRTVEALATGSLNDWLNGGPIFCLSGVLDTPIPGEEGFLEVQTFLDGPQLDFKCRQSYTSMTGVVSTRVYDVTAWTAWV